MSHYLSKERYEELLCELEAMKTSGRIEIAERLKRAKEFGDLSENAEYSAAREAQDRLEMRLDELEDIVKNVVLIEKPKKRDVVSVGSSVVVRKNDAEERTFTIVGSTEADPASGRISNESPIGSVLLGTKVGETVSVQSPTGETRYTIVEIR